MTSRNRKRPPHLRCILLCTMQYINLLRKCKMRERLRLAREAMHSRFPFSENLWLEWLQDELRQDAEHSRIRYLFEKATQDYLSTKVWAMYIR